MEREFSDIGRLGEVENHMAGEQCTRDVLANAAKDNIVIVQDNLEWRRRVGAWRVEAWHLVRGRGDSRWVLERGRAIFMKLGVGYRHWAVLVARQVVERGNRRDGGGGP